MIVLYFTSTGNSLYIAKRIGGENYSIPSLLRDGRFIIENEKIGIVFPVFYVGVPKIVEKYLSHVKLKSDYIFGVLSYGMFSGAATRHLDNIGKRNGINFSYINEILMIDNYLPRFDMNRQVQSQNKKRIEENLSIIVNEVNSGKKYIKRHTGVTEILRSIYQLLYDKNFERKFSVDSSCNVCKVCQKVCPVDNIEVNRRPVFMNNCQHCLACIHHCPRNAISIAGEKNKARFINQNIKLKDIIDSNNQDHRSAMKQGLS
jgi:ferredoxin